MRAKAVRAIYWSIADTLVRQGTLLLFTIVLARLLTPAEFGLVAMLSVFVGIASILVEGGLGAALVQSGNPSQTDKSTLFWAQVALGAVLGGGLALCGPVIATLLQQPSLAPMCIAFGINILISAPASIQTNLAIREMAFAAPVTIGLVAQIVAGVAAVVAALNGAGPWAIILQGMVSSAIYTGCLWFVLPWRPSFSFSVASLRRYSSFGVFTVLTGMFGELENRIGSLLIGRFMGAAETGQYQRAVGLQVLLSRLLSGIVTRVAFPAFSAIQADKPRLLNAVREASFINMALTAPAMWGIALLSEPLTLLIFGPAWASSAPVLTAACFAGGFYSIYAVGSKTLRAIGHARLAFVHQLVRAIGVFLVCALTYHHGLAVLAWAQALFLIACLLMTMVSLSRRLGYPMVAQFGDALPTVVSGAAMTGVVLLLDHQLRGLGELQLVILSAAAGASVFVGTMLATIRLFPTEPSVRASATVRAIINRGTTSE